MYGLLGGLAGKVSPPKPTGDEAYHMRVVALQSDGIPIGFTTYRPSDLTGFRPAWYEFVVNSGDVDLPPIGVPMRARHFKVPGF
jgi:hypothetical protein